jgi:MFS-type transporter involved in bile tolerance (Atg22 family)
MDVGGIVGPIFLMALTEGFNTRTAFTGGTVMLLVIALLLLTIKQESKK